MSKVSGEILINRLSSRFSTMSSTSATNRSTTREARMSWSGWFARGTTAAAWPPGRPPWAPAGTNDLDRAQASWWDLAPGIDRALIKNRVDDLRWSDVVDGR
jgi:hypothetical protein